MPRISAVINTRNEESNIRYCLESVKWCDEIIVVDMESEDRTVAIAREYNARIFTHERVLAFDNARKCAVEKAAGDWILLIDADELVPKALSYRLREIARSNDADVVYMPFKTYIMGTWITHTGWWPDYHPRFFKRGSIEFIGTVHAFMRVKGNARQIYLSQEEINAVEHFAYCDGAHFITRLNRYTTIEAQHLYDAKVRFSMSRMFVSASREFICRYFIYRGYKDGYRGLFLSMMMAFYRTLSYIKLWEKIQNGDTSIERKYNDLKNNIVKEYSNNT